MSWRDLITASQLAAEAAEQRRRANVLAARTNSANKAEAARLDNAADLTAEAAQGAIRNDLNLSNEMGVGLREKNKDKKIKR